jgi:hypothetical protein
VEWTTKIQQRLSIILFDQVTNQDIMNTRVQVISFRMALVVFKFTDRLI